MAGKIGCSYESCSRWFDTVEAMRKHKAKDKIHDFYCKKCDEDCEDDEEYLLHQIISPKHRCCPLCGKEFESEGGRSRHVVTQHRAKQNMRCPACDKHFESAASFMSHIEKDECKHIKKEHFLKQRAERQILQEALDTAVDPFSGSIILNTASSVTDCDQNINNILDSCDRVHIHRDWDGTWISNQHANQNSQAALEKYPSLPIRGKNELDRNTAKSAPEASVNLLDLWNEEDLNAEIDDLFTTEGNKPEKGTNVPSASHLENSGSVAPQNQIQQVPERRMQKAFDFEQYYNVIESVYICPGAKCGRRYHTVDEFEQHLLSGVHAPSQVACPCCMKRFKSTTALIAHCESGSMKCRIRETMDIGKVIQEITGGMIAVEEQTEDGNLNYRAVPLDKW